MSHLFALLAISIFQPRSKPAMTIWLSNTWKSSALAVGIIGALTNTAYADGILASAQLETSACETIMGLNPSEAQYAACLGSLDQSLAATYHKNDLSADANDVSWNSFQRACAEIGIRPHSRTFKKCVVDLSATLLKLDSIPGR